MISYQLIQNFHIAKETHHAQGLSLIVQCLASLTLTSFKAPGATEAIIHNYFALIVRHIHVFKDVLLGVVFWVRAQEVKHASIHHDVDTIQLGVLQEIRSI